MRGQRVCKMHGGKAPQALRTAAERLAALVDPAITRLTKLIDGASDAVAFAAVKDVLDRAGYGAKQRIDIEVRIRTMAVELGLDPDEVVAEAQRIIEAGSAASR